MIIISILVLSCKKNGAGGGNSVRVPTLNTDVTNITKNSARFGSWISSDGGASITSKGFCYSTSPNPTTSSTTIAGVGTDNISATVTGLNSSTTYYVKSYAINSAGTGYGEQETFTTLAPYSIGETYGGGVIFYIDASGLHGLIRTPSDLLVSLTIPFLIPHRLALPHLTSLSIFIPIYATTLLYCTVLYCTLL